MSAVTEFQEEVERVEEAYEFMISFAGQGLGREEQTEGDAEEIRSYLLQLRDGLEAGVEAAADIPDEEDVAGAEEYETFVDGLAEEIEEATLILDLLAAQDLVTSAQVDDINGMSVFQSIVMKFFFLDDLTEHLAYE
jgi:hypothetical protein